MRPVPTTTLLSLSTRAPPLLDGLAIQVQRFTLRNDPLLGACCLSRRRSSLEPGKMQRTFAQVARQRPWHVCTKCGPKSWVYKDRGLDTCSFCDTPFPQDRDHWPDLRVQTAKTGRGKGKGKGSGKPRSEGPPSSGDQDADNPTPKPPLSQDAIDRVRNFLSSSSDELKALLLPLVEEQAPSKPEASEPTVGSVGR